MNLLFYAVLFFIGAFCGKIYKLVIYRIPRNMDIFKKHYFGDMNEEKISKILEILYSAFIGIVFVIIAYALKLNVESLNLFSIIKYCITILYLSTLIIIAGIDKENIKVDKKVLSFGTIVAIIYMIYMCTINNAVIYKYAIYLMIHIVLVTLDMFLLKKRAKDSYTIDTLILLNIMLILGDVRVLFYTIWITLLTILIDLIILKIRQKKSGNKQIKLSEIPIGFFLCVSNMVTIGIQIIISNYI